MVIFNNKLSHNSSTFLPLHPDDNALAFSLSNLFLSILQLTTNTKCLSVSAKVPKNRQFFFLHVFLFLWLKHIFILYNIQSYPGFMTLVYLHSHPYANQLVRNNLSNSTVDGYHPTNILLYLVPYNTFCVTTIAICVFIT